MTWKYGKWSACEFARQQHSLKMYCLENTGTVVTRARQPHLRRTSAAVNRGYIHLHGKPNCSYATNCGCPKLRLTTSVNEANKMAVSTPAVRGSMVLTEAETSSQKRIN